jgi:hypothetical protein
MRAGLGVRGRLIDLADAVVPAEAALYDLSFGMQRTNVAGVLVSSGLADAIGEGARGPVELAHELGLDADVTVRVLEAAVASRLVRLDRDGRASLTGLGAALRSDHPHAIASWVADQAAPARAQAYAQLGAQLREGAEPSGHRRAFGNSIWDHYGQHPEEGAGFANAMRELTMIDLPALVRAYPWPRRGVICDVAGGTGMLLAAILARRKAARGILLDAPEVIEQADGFLRSRGVVDRIERRPGDLFGGLKATADLYILKWILHDWSDDACRDILARVRATMPTGAKVVTIGLHSERGRPNVVTSMVDLHMLVVCEGGRERSPEEVHGLMRDVGLRPGRVKHSGVQMLVEGVAD